MPLRSPPPGSILTKKQHSKCFCDREGRICKPLRIIEEQQQWGDPSYDHALAGAFDKNEHPYINNSPLYSGMNDDPTLVAMPSEHIPPPSQPFVSAAVTRTTARRAFSLSATGLFNGDTEVRSLHLLLTAPPRRKSKTKPQQLARLRQVMLARQYVHRGVAEFCFILNTYGLDWGTLSATIDRLLASHGGSVKVPRGLFLFLFDVIRSRWPQDSSDNNSC